MNSYNPESIPVTKENVEKLLRGLEASHIEPPVHNPEIFKTYYKIIYYEKRNLTIEYTIFESNLIMHISQDPYFIFFQRIPRFEYYVDLHFSYYHSIRDFKYKLDKITNTSAKLIKEVNYRYLKILTFREYIRSVADSNLELPDKIKIYINTITLESLFDIALESKRDSNIFKVIIQHFISLKLPELLNSDQDIFNDFKINVLNIYIKNENIQTHDVYLDDILHNYLFSNNSTSRKLGVLESCFK